MTHKFEVVFTGTVLSQRIHFVVLIFKSSFKFLGAIKKCQKYSESEVLHKPTNLSLYVLINVMLIKTNHVYEIGEVIRYPKDRMTRLKMD